MPGSTLRQINWPMRETFGKGVRARESVFRTDVTSYLQEIQRTGREQHTNGEKKYKKISCGSIDIIL